MQVFVNAVLKTDRILPLFPRRQVPDATGMRTAVPRARKSRLTRPRPLKRHPPTRLPTRKTTPRSKADEVHFDRAFLRHTRFVYSYNIR